MTNLPAERLLTADDLMRLPDDGYQYELEEGRLIRMPPAGPLASIIAFTIGRLVGNFVAQHRLGIVGGADFGMILARDPDTVRAPDVAFYRSERLPATGIPSTYWELAPDLAVEVLSPSDRRGKVLRKVSEYLDAGTPLVWVVDPQRRTAVVYRPEGEPTIVGADGVLDGEDVLPGFTLALADVWAA
jgi:Uma2 family endonuclease